jgi:uncharacterized protein (TIGR00269 family)
MARQAPVLPVTHEMLVRRVKPLFRLTERETATYAFLRGLDYVVEECPFSTDAVSLFYKELLNQLEERSPGSKHNFYLGFLERARPAFEKLDSMPLTACLRCGQTTTGEICAFCRLADQVKAKQLSAISKQRSANSDQLRGSSIKC